MSGGVDSSVAAARLVETGYEAVGVTMRVWGRGDETASRFGSCCGSDAVDDARRVAERLGIPYYLLNMAEEFDRAVIAPFTDSYARGRTPVPCVACNSELKFGSLLARARAWDATAVATGHYARVERDARTERFTLLRARDRRKDQSDFLWPLTQAQLAAARFPIGDLTKDEVREHARRLGLVTADKPDSQEICFVPDGDYRGFLRRRDPGVFRPGAIVDVGGHVLGRHAGVANFTVGQRKGLGLDRPAPDGKPRYVLSITPVSNTVTVGPAAALEVTTVYGDRPLWTGPSPVSVDVQLRAHGSVVPAQVTVSDGRLVAELARPVRGVAAGQAIVGYQPDPDGDIVLGSATISHATSLAGVA